MEENEIVVLYIDMQIGPHVDLLKMRLARMEAGIDGSDGVAEGGKFKRWEKF